MIVNMIGQQLDTGFLKETCYSQAVPSLDEICQDWLLSSEGDWEPLVEDISSEAGEETFNMVMDVFDQYVNDEIEICNNKQEAGDMDVICGRGRQAYNHPGNRRFRKLVEDNYGSYSGATSKVRKSMVVSSILDKVREWGCFVKEDPKSGVYIGISDRLAREKIGQGLRDMLHAKYKSSTKAKTRKRVAKRAIRDEHLHQLVLENSIVTSLVGGVTKAINENAGNGFSDFLLEQQFLEMNTNILEELKRSKLAEVFAAASQPQRR